MMLRLRGSFRVGRRESCRIGALKGVGGRWEEEGERMILSNPFIYPGRY